jgi:hypothetical protein
MGLLVAWLQSGAAFADHNSHVHMLGDAGQHARAYDTRRAARADARAIPNCAALFDQERPRVEGEGDELERCP